jgi:uncharacterized protein YjbJ (UPF0337 family)
VDQEKSNLKQSTQHQIAGKLHETAGKIKQVIGHATNNPDLEAEGIGEKVGGKVQGIVGRIEKAVGE